MNCEKCKSRKATLFFSDENGRRRALCTSCGALLGKAVSPTSLLPEESTRRYIPSPTLSNLITSPVPLVSIKESDSGAVCRGCGISAEELISGGEIGCPDCYESFGGRIFPSLPTSSSVYSARMPSARRKRLDRERRLTELRVELRRAIDGECFELAATLRDKIRDLEKQ